MKSLPSFSLLTNFLLFLKCSSISLFDIPTVNGNRLGDPNSPPNDIHNKDDHDVPLQPNLRIRTDQNDNDANNHNDYPLWDNKIHGDVTLIISDWKGSTPELVTFLSQDIPDFITETIVIASFGTVIDVPKQDNKSKIRLVHRAGHGSRDLCSVVINTKWFIATSTYAARLKPQIPLVTPSGKVLAGATTVEASQCHNVTYCRPDLVVAEAFDQLNPQVFFPDDFVFHTGMRNEYCKRIMPLYFDERFTYAKPSATSYIAFLESINAADDYYEFSNYWSHDCRPKVPTKFNEQGCEEDVPQDQGGLCPMHVSKDACLANPNCVHRPKYGNCNNSDNDQIAAQRKLAHVRNFEYPNAMEYHQELVQAIRDAHQYWLNPNDPAAADNNDNNGYKPISHPNDLLQEGNDLPDKLFLCADYYEQLIFFPYFEGEVYVLSHTGVMFFHESHIPDHVRAFRETNLDIVNKHATEHSLLLGNVLYMDECLPDPILDFPGRQLLRNTEPQDFNYLTYGEQHLYPFWAKKRGLPQVPDPHYYLPPSDKIFVIGTHEDSPTSLRVPYLSFVITYKDKKSRDMLFNHEMKPVGTKEHFLIYAASHFVAYREEAANKLAQIGGHIHTVGLCQGTGKEISASCIPYEDHERPSHIVLSPYDNDKESGVTGNHALFSNYRFAMVLENTKQDGYITEKLTNAFLSGTVPIWYGTRDVFEIFNEKAIIYYDIENPEPALQRIAYLEQNSTAYDEMTREPILANNSAGKNNNDNDVMEKYFSLRDEFGGKIKKQILDLVGIRDSASTAIFESFGASK